MPLFSKSLPKSGVDGPPATDLATDRVGNHEDAGYQAAALSGSKTGVFVR